MLKLTNTTSTALTAGQVIPLNVELQTNPNVTYDTTTNKITFNKNGIYNLQGMFTFTSATVGDYTVQMYADGTAVEEATATETIATADDYITINLSDYERIINQYTTTTKATIWFTISAAATITNANVGVTEIR